MEKDTNIATLVFWKNIEDKERIERWLKKLTEEGFIDVYQTGTYNPAFGEPCWYIP